MKQISVRKGLDSGIQPEVPLGVRESILGVRKINKQTRFNYFMKYQSYWKHYFQLEFVKCSLLQLKFFCFYFIFASFVFSLAITFLSYSTCKVVHNIYRERNLSPGHIFETNGLITSGVQSSFAISQFRASLSCSG